MVREMDKENFIAWRNLYSQRLNYLGHRLDSIKIERDSGTITPADAASRVSAINKEIEYIIECGTVMNSLRKRDE